MEITSAVEAQVDAARPAIIGMGIVAAIIALGLLDDLALAGAVHRTLESGYRFDLHRWAEARPADALMNGLGALSIPAMLLVGMIFLTWFYRAYVALQSIGSGRTSDSPAWVVASCVIPVVQLVKPYFVMRELWQRSSTGNPHGGTEATPVPRYLLAWWLLFVGGAVGTRVGRALIPNSPDPSALRLALGIRLIAAVALIAAAFLAIRLIGDIRDGQTSAALGID